MTSGVRTSYQRVEEIDQDVADALLRWTLSLADTKHRVGIRTSEWVNGGPALEAAVGASAITQDELGHARSLYAMLKDFSSAPADIGAENDLEARDEFFCPRLLNEPWPSWLDVIAVNVLVDRATNIAVAAGRTSSFGPLKGRTAKMLQEEQFHRIFGDSWLAKIARMGDPMQGKLQASLNHFWETAAAWFGPDDDEEMARLRNADILDRSPEAMRSQWLDEVTVLLEKHEFTLPPSELDWAGWSGIYRDLA